jgi:hypothetical protein
MKHIFGAPDAPGSNSAQVLPASKAAAPARMKLELIKERMQQQLDDFADNAAVRLKYRMSVAHDANDLWLLRSDLYQYISRAHSQLEAGRRVNSLLPCFEGWLGTHQLVKI